MRHRPLVLSERTVARSRYFHVQERVLRFRSGEERCIERLLDDGHRAVLIVAMLDSDRFVLVEEYAPGADRFVLGLPMGGMAPGETAEDAVRRELREEIGYSALEVHALQQLSIVPTHLQHTVTVCLARELRPASAEGDEPEALIGHSHRLSCLHEIIADGRLTEARSIAGAFMARDWLLRETSPK